jgi:hypothetical protein
MTAQATAMPRQHPQGLTTVSGDRRHRRRALATATLALAAPLFAVTVLAAFGAATDSGGAGLGSLPGASGLKGESGTAVPSQPLDAGKWDRPKDYEKAGSGEASRRRTASAPPDSNGRDTIEKLPPRAVVPVDIGRGGSPAVTDVPTDPSAPGYPGGDDTGGSGSSGSGSSGSGTSGSSGSGTSGSGTSGSGVSSGTSGSGGGFSG